MIKIKIADDFSETPGGRYISEGPYSGEKFRKEILRPRYDEAKSTGKKIFIDLDDCYGYATSFLEEAFGGLARELGSKKILDIIEFKSDDEPGLIQMVRDYVNEVKI